MIKSDLDNTPLEWHSDNAKPLEMRGTYLGDALIELSDRFFKVGRTSQDFNNSLKELREIINSPEENI